MAKSESPFVSIKHHALLPLAESIRAADAIFAPLITQAALETILALVPDAWLTAEPTAEATRSAYVEHLFRRVSGARAFVEEAERVRVV